MTFMSGIFTQNVTYLGQECHLCFHVYLLILIFDFKKRIVYTPIDKNDNEQYTNIIVRREKGVSKNELWYL